MFTYIEQHKRPVQQLVQMRQEVVPAEYLVWLVSIIGICEYVLLIYLINSSR